MTFAPALSLGFTHAPRRPGGLMRRLIRLGLMATGSVLVVAGIIIAPLPGPFGLPISVLGLALVLRNSYWAKRQFIRAQYARPKFIYPFRRLLRSPRQFPPVMWQQLLRTEKVVLKRANRVLGRGRKTLRRFIRGLVH